MKEINLISFFDGMSCGQIALNELGIVPEKYFASEIKKHAIKCTQHNFPKTIQLGDIKNIHYNDGYFELIGESKLSVYAGKINLVIGGSPCQDLSSANKIKSGLSGSKSVLFFEYVRLLNQIKKTNPDVKFLLENVGSMDNESIRIISQHLGLFPVRINSSLVSSQLRDRLYWTNIRTKQVGLFGEIYTDIPQPEDKNILLEDIIESGTVDRDKSLCVLARYKKSAPSPLKYEKRYRMGMMQIVYEQSGPRLLTQLEIERLQTVPEGYTNCLSYNQAVDVLGDGWTISVIKHILSFLVF